MNLWIKSPQPKDILFPTTQSKEIQQIISFAYKFSDDQQIN